MRNTPERASADEEWMRKALELAYLGLGRTSPNPAVGAVLVQNGTELASGWHRKAGMPHAEIVALGNLENPALANGATLYVTLEPCSSHGRTPPCTDAIIRAGCRRVVWGATDPDLRHQGRARQVLESHGIEVTSGVLEKECTHLNRAWNHWVKTGLPWVIVKAGQSLDGRLSPPPPGRIVTSEESRADVMKLRSQCDAILVGGRTLRADLPQLTVRGIPNSPQPRRVVWTRDRSSLPDHAPIFHDAGAENNVISSAPSFEMLCRELGSLGIVSLLVEGGGAVHGAAVDSHLVNEFVIYTAPVLFGAGTTTIGGIGAADNESSLRLSICEVRKLGPDLRIQALCTPPDPISLK